MLSGGEPEMLSAVVDLPFDIGIMRRASEAGLLQPRLLTGDNIVCIQSKAIRPSPNRLRKNALMMV